MGGGGARSRRGPCAGLASLPAFPSPPPGRLYVVPKGERMETVGVCPPGFRPGLFSFLCTFWSQPVHTGPAHAPAGIHTLTHAQTRTHSHALSSSSILGTYGVCSRSKGPGQPAPWHAPPPCKDCFWAELRGVPRGSAQVSLAQGERSGQARRGLHLPHHPSSGSSASSPTWLLQSPELLIPGCELAEDPFISLG